MKTNTQPHIFRTDIGALCTNCAVHKALDNHKDIQSWSIDPEDKDCVLSVVSDTLTPTMIIEIINQLGHQCHELS